jgi:hypothetical protein
MRWSAGRTSPLNFDVGDFAVRLDRLHLDQRKLLVGFLAEANGYDLSLEAAVTREFGEFGILHTSAEARPVPSLANGGVVWDGLACAFCPFL